MPQALRQVRDDLGDRAVILDTRKLPPGADPQACVEITAALDEARATAAPVADSAPSPALQPRGDLLGRLYGDNGSREPSTASRTTPRWRDEPDDDVQHTRSAAQWLANLPRVTREGEDVHRRTPAGEEGTEAVRRSDPIQPPPPLRDGGTDPIVLSQLRQLEDVVHRMARKANGFELPPEIGRLGERLRRTGLIDSHVHGCLQELMRTLGSELWDDPEAVAQAAARILVDMLPPRCDLRVGKGRKIVALAGPSGAGKTTAAAKVASGFARRRQQRGGRPASEIVLISTDGRRVGAQAQAQAFADLIGVGIDAAYDGIEMAAAVARHPDTRLILIDLAGCGPHERTQIDHQRQLLDAAGVDEVHQVLDGLTGYDHIVESCKAFSGVASHRLLFSKMDQAVRPGVVVSAAIDCGVETSYLTTSAQLPGGIRPGNLTPFVEWMVGQGPRPFVEASDDDAA